MQKSNALQSLPQVIVDCGGTKTAKNGDTNNDGACSLLLKPKKNGAQDQSTQAASEKVFNSKSDGDGVPAGKREEISVQSKCVSRGQVRSDVESELMEVQRSVVCVRKRIIMMCVRVNECVRDF